MSDKETDNNTWAPKWRIRLQQWFQPTWRERIAILFGMQIHIETSVAIEHDCGRFKMLGGLLTLVRDGKEPDVQSNP